MNQSTNQHVFDEGASVEVIGPHLDSPTPKQQSVRHNATQTQAWRPWKKRLFSRGKYEKRKPADLT